ncbi:hypothetical protein [Devosia sp.]|uniref:hypothetical protein n=1 Tax=Devosia sp. TaxID=1871048 RepID=UPI002AFF1B22|nr:hypothetical protein [Devosia sp.]
MSAEVERLRNRFDGLFAEEGLTNIKFFVRKGDSMTAKDFVRELNAIQDVISEGDFEIVDSIDSAAKVRRFDDPY